MKISYKWLKDLIEFDETPEEIGKRLTGTGLEVEGIEEVESIKGGLKGVVIGEVVTCEKHPEADKLSITTVNVGQEELLPIVCGAPNVAQGQKVLVATVGTTLYPGGGEDKLVIKKAKIRGAVSEGMICAEDELGLGASHDGIMVLDTELPAGTPASTYLNLSSDYCIEIGLTPNRADAASHYGVARDIKALFNKHITLPDVEGFSVENNDLPIQVVVENYEAAPRYAGVTLSGIKVGASPDWLKQRLEVIGVRPINNVVDVTNYVCHELGQPLHAFDAAKIIGGKVIVKTCEEGKSFVTLDGVERKLASYDLMICNAEEPMCIAGVFGGADSGVSEETTSIFLESAYFSPAWVRKTSLNHGLKTDASFRFERGTDPNMPLFALKRAALLIKEIAGGVISSEVTDLYPNPIENFKVPVKYSNIDRLLGVRLDRNLIQRILFHLDIRSERESETGFIAVVPPYRVDVTREADVIEEILRIYGFDNLGLSDHLQSDFLSSFPIKDVDDLRLRVSEMLAGNGFNEIINNSLTRPDTQAALATDLIGEDVKILNYLSEDLSVMRQSLLISSLTSVAYNINRRQKNLKFFEFGKSYHLVEGKYVENNKIALVLTGNDTNESWVAPARPVQFSDLAAAVTKVFGLMRVSKVKIEPYSGTMFDQGTIWTLNGQEIARLGKVATKVAKLTDIKAEVFYAELNWDLLFKGYNAKVGYVEVSKFPEVRRDLSLVVEKSVTFDALEQLAYKIERKLLREVNVFDVYEGANLNNKKAYALSFILQDPKQTLTDKEIDKTMQRLMTAYETEFGAVIRK